MTLFTQPDPNKQLGVLLVGMYGILISDNTAGWRFAFHCGSGDLGRDLLAVWLQHASTTNHILYGETFLIIQASRVSVSCVVRSASWDRKWAPKVLNGSHIFVSFTRTLILFATKLQYSCKRRQDEEGKQSDKAAIRDLVLTFCPTMRSIQQRKLKLLMPVYYPPLLTLKWALALFECWHFVQVIAWFRVQFEINERKSIFSKINKIARACRMSAIWGFWLLRVFIYS